MGWLTAQWVMMLLEGEIGFYPKHFCSRHEQIGGCGPRMATQFTTCLSVRIEVVTSVAKLVQVLSFSSSVSPSSNLLLAECALVALLLRLAVA